MLVEILRAIVRDSSVKNITYRVASAYANGALGKCTRNVTRVFERLVREMENW